MPVAREYGKKLLKIKGFSLSDSEADLKIMKVMAKVLPAVKKMSKVYLITAAIPLSDSAQSMNQAGLDLVKGFEGSNSLHQTIFYFFH